MNQDRSDDAAALAPDGSASVPAPSEPVGLIDGAVPASTRHFVVALGDEAVVQLDDLLTCAQALPDGRTISHYGIVVEATGYIEGATYATDTARITQELTMPGVTTRRAEVQILRSIPELWLAPDPGSPVGKATGADRDAALFLDQMTAPLAAGLDQSGEPVFLDFAFLNGEKGGHVNISGISGVATKTSYALFLLYQLMETAAGRSLLGTRSPDTHALVFNVKGEDLLQIDRPNAQFDRYVDARERWSTLSVDEPGPFTSVRLYAPRAAGAHKGSAVPDVISRASDEVAVYGWSPADFVRLGLLRFCFTEGDEAGTQIGFVEQRVRLQLARHAYPLAGEPDAVVLAQPPADSSHNFDRVIHESRPEREAGEGVLIRDFSDLVNFIDEKVENEDPDWIARVAPTTAHAFLRRLWALIPRIGHLITPHVQRVDIQQAAVSVVDIHSLHYAAQRFVVGALLDEVFESKQGLGREPLRFIVLDELNKYAPREGRSPLKELLVDIAERGRSLGVLLIGAQQAASAVDPAIIRNAAIKVVGRLDAAESSEYRFLTSEMRERATRFLPGTMVLDQPLIPAPIPFRFPFPGFATNVAEGRPSSAEHHARSEEVFKRL